MELNDLSERFAHSTKAAGDKPAAQCFGWIVSEGTFKPGLLYNAERVRAKTLTFELYEPDKDNEPVYLGRVTVKLQNHLKPCGPGAMHTGLELEVIHAERT